MDSMFPIPRITESFIDAVVSSMGWKRYLDVNIPAESRSNADYLTDNSIIELKILEEEGVEKIERQKKIAELFSKFQGAYGEIDISFENIPNKIRHEMETLVSKPIQGVVKKASKQIRHTREDLDIKSNKGVLLIINNGYSYLNADDFEKLVFHTCSKDSSQIDFAYCVTVDYHQGDFDAFVFCTIRCHAVTGQDTWIEEEKLRIAIQDKFNDAMTQMMRDQMNPELWVSNLQPVSDILFDRNGVRYIRKAPEVPDSRLWEY